MRAKTNKCIVSIGVVVFLALLLNVNGSLIFAENEVTLENVEAINDRLNKQRPMQTRSNNWHIETVESGKVGYYSSLKFDSNDKPHIAYSEDSVYNLKYAYFNGAKWVTETVDSYGSAGEEPSLDLDSNNHPHISYRYATDNGCNLKYAYYDGNTWNIQTIDNSQRVGFDSSIAIDSKNHVHISYFDDTNDNLTYAYYDGNSWNIEVVDSDKCGEFSSIDVDSFDRPHITYYGDGVRWILKYAYYAEGNWHIETISEINRYGNSLVIDGNDRAHISFVNDSSLMYAHYNGAWEFTKIESSPIKVREPSISLDSKNLPHICYLDFFNNEVLKYASYDGFSWSRETVAMQKTYNPSICTNSIDKPNICYRAGNEGGLEYAFIDNILPSSSVINSDQQFIKTTPFSIDINASDNSNQGVKDIALWYRYSSNNNSWSGWEFYGIDNSIPWSFAFDSSLDDGYYQFYSVANDTAGNQEETPVLPDATIIYDTQRPASSIEDITLYWYDTIPVSINTYASDNLSGVKTIELWYRFSMNNVTWGDWISFGTKAWPSCSFNFTPLNVDGNYQFYTIAEDEAGNTESIPLIKYAECGIEIASSKIYENYTYKNITYQNGTCKNVTFRNITYKNYTNQSGDVLYQNTTNDFVNYTYLNETLLLQNIQLEDKLNWAMKKLNETVSGEKRASKSKNDTYSDPIAIVLLVIIIVLMILLVLRRRKKKETIGQTKGIYEQNKPVDVSVPAQVSPQQPIVETHSIPPQQINVPPQAPPRETQIENIPHPQTQSPPQAPPIKNSPQPQKPNSSDKIPMGLFRPTSTIGCKICFGYIKSNSPAFRCNCKNVYHPVCIARVKNCPVCKQVIRAEDVGIQKKGIEIHDVSSTEEAFKKVHWIVEPKIHGTKEDFQINDMYLIYVDGRLIKSVSFQTKLSAGMDEDIMSGMLTAVTDFIKDSFSEESGGLKSLQYGNMTIYMERGITMYLAVVFQGRPPDDLRMKMRMALVRIWEKYQRYLKVWDGSYDGLDYIDVDLVERIGLENAVRKQDIEDEYQPPKFTGDILTSEAEESILPNIVTTADVSTLQGCYHLYNMLLGKKGLEIRIGDNSSQDEISKARKKIIILYHPDRWPPEYKEKATFFMQKINVAWEVLSKR